MVASLLNAQTDIEKLQAEIDLLKTKSDVLTEELLDISTGTFTKVDDSKAHNGLGAAASKVYYSESPLSIGGYGEMYWAKTEGKRAYVDVYRFIPYIGYRFSDSVILNTEIEFEHGDTSKGGKVLIEFMYLDFLINKSANIRVGNLLVPMGLTNLRHEPTLFPTVIRPSVERHLIPSTWHENGVLVYGDIADTGIEYTAGIINALNLNSNHTKGVEGGINSKWIRSGRIGSSNKGVFKPAGVGRVDYRGINGLLVGGSLYVGDGSNAKEDISGTTMSIFEVHAQYEYQGLTLKGLYTQSNLKDADKFAAKAVEKASGYLVNASYDVGAIAGSPYKIPLFVQYENYNLVEKRADGTSDEATNKYNVGVNFYPTPQTVLKADYQIIDDKNKEDTENTLYLSLGFLF
jgi:hypothetical protein